MFNRGMCTKVDLSFDKNFAHPLNIGNRFSTTFVRQDIVFDLSVTLTDIRQETTVPNAAFLLAIDLQIIA